MYNNRIDRVHLLRVYVLVLFVAVNTWSTSLALGIKETKHCFASTNSSIVTNCTVLYNQTVVLICPVNGTWWKDHGKFLSRNSNYSLPEQQGRLLSFHNDNGVYYCQNSKSGPNYRIRLSIKGPPEFVSYKNHTFNPDTGRYTIEFLKEDKYQTNITIMVVGYGPFAVSWTFDQSTEDVCLHNSIHCYNSIVNDTATTFTYRITYPYYTSMVGWYRATVRNEYGANDTKIYLGYACPEPSIIPVSLKPPSHSNETVVLKKGGISLPCIASMNNKNSYGICYGKENETFKSVYNKPGRCVECTSGVQNCTKFMDTVHVISVERYTMSQSRSIEDCNDRGLILKLASFDDDKVLNFYCYWRVNYLENDKFGGQYRVVLAKNNQTVELLISVVVSVSVVIILLLILLFACGVIKHRRIKRSRQDTVSDKCAYCDQCDNRPDCCREDTVSETQSILNYSHRSHFGSVQSFTYGSLPINSEYNFLSTDMNSRQKTLV